MTIDQKDISIILPKLSLEPTNTFKKFRNHTYLVFKNDNNAHVLEKDFLQQKLF